MHRAVIRQWGLCDGLPLSRMRSGKTFLLAIIMAIHIEIVVVISLARSHDAAPTRLLKRHPTHHPPILKPSLTRHACAILRIFAVLMTAHFFLHRMHRARDLKAQ
jgi:hypothetical protein